MPPKTMPIFRIDCNDPRTAARRVFYVEGETSELARRLITSRGIAVTSIEQIEPSAVPRGEGVQRVAPPGPPPLTPVQRRKMLILLGVGIALFLCAGVVFVLRAKEHIMGRRAEVQQERATPASGKP